MGHGPRSAQAGGRPRRRPDQRSLLQLTLITLLGCGERLAPRVPPPEEDPSRSWEILLAHATDDEGRVDYELIRDNRETLDEMIAWNAVHGPLTDVWSEGQEARHLAFHINAYNAAVIYGVLEHWPLDSVQDVEVGLFSSGFFTGLRFQLDGAWRDLRAFGQKYTVARYQAPQVHMALNGAGEGCPELRYYHEDELQEQLDAATTAFLMSERGMRRTEHGYAVSELLLSNQDDFVEWGAASTLCGWMSRYAEGPRREWLILHRRDCPLESFARDWSLDAQSR